MLQPFYHHLVHSEVMSHQARVYSQNGEDGVLLYILKHLSYPMRCFEIGAGVVNGNLECNTAILLSNGWHGEIVDTEPIKHPWCRQLKITPENIGKYVDDDLGVLSIDVDGNDYWLWKALEVDPAVVIIEYNSHLDPKSRLVQPYSEESHWDGSDYFGASAGALIGLATEKRYHFVGSVSTTNLVFVRRNAINRDCCGLLPWTGLSGQSLNQEWLDYFSPWLGPVKRHPTDRSERKYMEV